MKIRLPLFQFSVSIGRGISATEQRNTQVNSKLSFFGIGDDDDDDVGLMSSAAGLTY